MTDEKKSKSSIRKHPIDKRKSSPSKKRQEEQSVELPLAKILIILGVIAVIGILVFALTRPVDNSNTTVFNVVIDSIQTAFSGGAKAEQGIAAMVNGQNITCEELNAEYALVPAASRATITKEYLLNQTITETVLMQEMDKRGIQVSQKEFEIIFNNTESQFMCEKQFNTTLAQNGWTYESFSEQLMLKMRLNKMLGQEIPELKVDETEMMKFFETNKDKLSTPEMVRARHILVDSSETAQEVIGKLKAGADFALLAQEYSKDTGSLVCDGELGFFTRGMMVESFENASFSLEVGEISEPIKSDFGYHIIEVLEKKPAKTADYEEVKPLIELTLLNSKLSANQAEINSYIEGLVEKADVVKPSKSC